MQVAIIGDKDVSTDGTRSYIAQLSGGTKVVVEKSRFGLEVEQLVKDRGLECKVHEPRWKGDDGERRKNAGFEMREDLVKSSDRIVLVGDSPVVKHALEQAKKHGKTHEAIAGSSREPLKAPSGSRSKAPSSERLVRVAIIGEKTFDPEIVRQYMATVPTHVQIVAEKGAPVAKLAEEVAKDRGLSFKAFEPRWKGDDGAPRKNAGFATREFLVKTSATVALVGSGAIVKHALESAQKHGKTTQQLVPGERVHAVVPSGRASERTPQVSPQTPERAPSPEVAAPMVETKSASGQHYYQTLFGTEDRAKHGHIAELSFRVPMQLAYDLPQVRAALDAQLPIAKSLGLTANVLPVVETPTIAVVTLRIPPAAEAHLKELGAEARAYQLPVAAARDVAGGIPENLSGAAPTPMQAWSGREVARVPEASPARSSR